jgi:hypothetical protein
MIQITLAALFAAAITVGGCAPTTAVVNGQTMQRPTLAYTDTSYYAVTHHLAYPEHRGASTGLRSYAGRIAGFACGADFNYEADYVGRSLYMTGFVQPVRSSVGRAVVRPALIEVHDRDGHRSFTGSIGHEMSSSFAAINRGSTVVDFSLGADGLHGQIASRRYDLEQSDADTLQGTMTLSTGAVLPFVLRGLSAIWAMEPADQAAIMPFMMSCARLEEGRHVEGVTTETATPLLMVDFRGRG